MIYHFAFRHPELVSGFYFITADVEKIKMLKQVQHDGGLCLDGAFYGEVVR